MNYTAEDSWIAEAQITLADLSPDKGPCGVEPSRRELSHLAADSLCISMEQSGRQETLLSLMTQLSA